MDEKTKAFVDACEQRTAKATPGPWGEKCGAIKHYAFSLDDGEDFGISLQELHWKDGREVPAHDNAVFIANARTDLPEALRIIREQDVEIESLKRLVRGQCDLMQMRAQLDNPDET
jgi:hypothetical protein